MSICPKCSHPDEGIAPPAFSNSLRRLAGRSPQSPQCSSYRTNGMDDTIMCGCRHEAHSHIVVASIYDAQHAHIDD